MSEEIRTKETGLEAQVAKLVDEYGRSLVEHGMRPVIDVERLFLSAFAAWIIKTKGVKS